MDRGLFSLVGVHGCSVYSKHACNVLELVLTEAPASLALVVLFVFEIVRYALLADWPVKMVENDLREVDLTKVLTDL